MCVLPPIPEGDSPNPDCSHCGGEGAPSLQQRILADEYSWPACRHCWVSTNEQEMED